jgi:hypothetical protein
LEVERSSNLERAKEAVARCSVTDSSKVETEKYSKTNKTVGEIVEIA